MKVLYSSYPVVVFFKVVEAKWEGKDLVVEGKPRKVRPLSFLEYLLACFLWTIPIFLVFYFYLLPYLLGLKLLSLAAFFLPVVLFVLFAAKGANVFGAILLVFPVIFLPFPSLLFDYVAGLVAGFGVHLLYLFGERGYKSESGEVIAIWKT